jgi:uncharacterized membrane protein YdbT with pleckstrin-like domain
MNKQEIKRSKKAIQFKTRAFTIVFVLIALVSIPILLIPFRVWSNNYIFWLLFTWMLASILWYAGINVIKTIWDKTKYYISDEAVFINYGSMFGSKERIIPFDSLVRANITQNYQEKRGDRGKIILILKDSTEKFALGDVEKPQDLADLILKNISESFVTKIIS